MNLHPLQHALGYTFQDETLLRQALTHPSVSYETKRTLRDNQRLEFLGDAVLQLSLTQKLYSLYPDMPEGDLTRLRSQLVSRASLAQAAERLQIGPLLSLGKGEENNQGRTRPSNLADAMEAVLGAVFLDSDFEQADSVILKLFEEPLSHPESEETSTNPKGALQEFLQAQGKSTPTYETLESHGPDHDRTFTVAVIVDDQEISRADGSSKKAAETSAALKALEVLKPE